MKSHAHKGLAGDSEVYVALSQVYDQFSRAEDFDGLILNELQDRIKDSTTVLDLGCGTGKYLSLLAPYATNFLGVDASSAQLAVARVNSAHCNNVTLVHGDIAEIDFGDRMFDTIISTWVLHTIRDKAKRLRAINRAFDRLQDGGCFYLVENDSRGEFEEIRNRVSASTEYNAWLVDIAGFTEYQRLETRFVFQDKAEAISVFSEIWGSEVAKKISSNVVKHNVVLFRRQKVSKRNGQGELA